MYARCLALRCWLSSHESLCPASAVMVVQKRKLLFGRPEKEMPRLKRLPLGCLEKRLVRFEDGFASREKGAEAGFGVGGREGGCEDSA